MRSNAARAWAFVVASALLLAACGQAPSPTSSAPTAAASTQPTAADATQPTAATNNSPTTTTKDSPTAASTGAVSGDAIPIGIAVAQTSNVALFGQEQVSGAQAAETYFNAKGGVNGHPIKLVLQDTGGDEAGA